MDPSFITTDQNELTNSEKVRSFLNAVTPDAANDFITESCNVPFDVKTVVPNWLVDEHYAGNSNFVKFFQHYFDWLYCTKESGLYTESIESLQDISNIIPETTSAFTNSFIPQLGLTAGQEEEFLKNFRRDIISKKGTPEGIALFFVRAFPEVESVTVTGSLLNQEINLEISGTMQDTSVYEEAYKYMKPVGINTTISTNSTLGSERTESSEDSGIEQRLAEFGFSTALSRGISFENPLIGNYLVYNQGDTGTIGYTSGCSGSSHARAIAANTADMPTYTHPNGVLTPAGASFGSINIYEFLYMPYDSSPNHGITGC